MSKKREQLSDKVSLSLTQILSLPFQEAEEFKKHFIDCFFEAAAFTWEGDPCVCVCVLGSVNNCNIGGVFFYVSTCVCVHVICTLYLFV